MMKLQASPPSEISEVNNSAQAHYTSAEMNQQQSNRKHDEQLSNRESTAYKQQNLGSSSTGPIASSSSLAQSHSYTPLIQQSEKDDDHPFTPPSPYNRSADKQTFSPSLHHQGCFRQAADPRRSPNRHPQVLLRLKSLYLTKDQVIILHTLEAF